MTEITEVFCVQYMRQLRTIILKTIVFEKDETKL